MEYEDWTTTGALGDRYVLRAQVGSGRTTTVYAATDVRLEREVAVKLFHGLPSGDAMARFAAEAQVLGGLSHANLVMVYDVGLAADPPYMVMRLIDGGPLDERIGDGLEPPVVARLGAHLSDALAYVHERGVVHGDIDTSNVLIDEKGAGHLTGFGAEGLAKPSGDIYAFGAMLASCLPDDVGPEWQVVLAGMTDADPDMRPDAIRCGELFRNIAAGQTADIPLLPFDEPEPEPDEDEPPAVRDAPPRKMRTAYAGIAGLGLGVVAAAAALSAVVNSPTGSPAGEPQQPPPQEEQPAEDAPGMQVPGQTYPAPAQREQTKAPPPTRHREQTRTQTPPAQTTTPPNGEYPGDDDSGNGNGNGNGNGRGNGGLLGGILGGIL